MPNLPTGKLWLSLVYYTTKVDDLQHNPAFYTLLLLFILYSQSLIPSHPSVLQNISIFATIASLSTWSLAFGHDFIIAVSFSEITIFKTSPSTKKEILHSYALIISHLIIQQHLNNYLGKSDLHILAALGYTIKLLTLPNPLTLFSKNFRTVLFHCKIIFYFILLNRCNKCFLCSSAIALS